MAMIAAEIDASERAAGLLFHYVRPGVEVRHAKRCIRCGVNANGSQQAQESMSFVDGVCNNCRHGAERILGLGKDEDEELLRGASRK